MVNLSLRRLATAVIGSVAVVTPALTVGAGPAAAVPPPTTYKVTVTRTVNDNVDFSRRVASCTGSEGTSCSITREKSVSTTIQVDGGVTSDYVAASIGFSKTKESSTSVTCNSPALKNGQTYSAFAIGTRKYYTISVLKSGSWVQVGGIKTAWEPHNYPSIWCGFY